MKLIFNIKTEGIIRVLLKEGKRVVDETDLTISQDLDNMLIRTIDKLLSRNKIERLSVKTAEILGKLKDQALSAMILKTVRTAVEI